MINPMHCMVCQDKRKAGHTLNDARRICNLVQRLEGYVKHKGYDLDAVTKESSHQYSRAKDLCLSHIHCMCGSCPEIRRSENEAHRYESKISELVLKFHYLMKEIKETDKAVYGHIKAELRPCLCGHYPRAARLIMDT